MERRIDRAVDHDEGKGANPPMPNASLTPLAKASGAALRAIAGQRVLRHAPPAQRCC